MPPTPDIAMLEPLSLKELRAKWATHYGTAPALRSPDLLRLILAWRLQAKTQGGLDRPTRRKLKRTGPVMAEGLDLGVGTRLKREWQSQIEEVLIERHGFSWKGELYPSLSAVALAITGTRWNGPRFFGLREPA
ncbi:MAG: DUF2924 domain-containing protein [Propionivibrio sp.]